MRKNIIQPNPVISHGVPAFCGNVSSDAAAANNADYHSFWASSSTISLSIFRLFLKISVRL